MEGEYGESRIFTLFNSYFIFGADYFPFTHSDIYGFVRTINATTPFPLLSNNVHILLNLHFPLLLFKKNKSSSLHYAELAHANLLPFANL